MSWSIYVPKGTKAATLRTLAAVSPPTSENEQSVFNATKTMLQQLVDGVQDAPSGQMLLVHATAAGHGPSCTTFTFMTEMVAA